MTDRTAVGIATAEVAVHHPRFNVHSTAAFIFQIAPLLELQAQRQCAKVNRGMRDTWIAMATE